MMTDYWKQLQTQRRGAVERGEEDREEGGGQEEDPMDSFYGAPTDDVSAAPSLILFATETEIRNEFLRGHIYFWQIDLSPLANVVKILDFFLSKCSGLKGLNLAPLSKVTEVGIYFCADCTGLTHIDLNPLSNLVDVSGFFLAGCTSLVKVELGLPNTIGLGRSFLEGCTSLPMLDFSQMEELKDIDTTSSLLSSQSSSFLYGCTALRSIVGMPPSMCAVNVATGWVNGTPLTRWVGVEEHAAECKARCLKERIASLEGTVDTLKDVYEVRSNTVSQIINVVLLENDANE